VAEREHVFYFEDAAVVRIVEESVGVAAQGSSRAARVVQVD